ncbi:hypothetical protein IFM89_037428 [Coptis chinensis]|uniref:Uncharacterized protein n=1 Tax=Coptis chinensis TaxID=261450 RepID=A0A835MBM3_9MAGN|nr:hypothetical protein IFM89_037428 [Coptis chinensis]
MQILTYGESGRSLGGGMIGHPADDMHIFRPFVGFKEVRLVSKEARHPGGDQLVLCFVDFGTLPVQRIAMDALQAILTVRTVARPSVCPSQSKAHTGSTAMRQGEPF